MTECFGPRQNTSKVTHHVLINISDHIWNCSSTQSYSLPDSQDMSNSRISQPILTAEKLWPGGIPEFVRVHPTDDLIDGPEEWNWKNWTIECKGWCQFVEVRSSYHGPYDSPILIMLIFH